MKAVVFCALALFICSAYSQSICVRTFGTNDTVQYQGMLGQIQNIVGLLLGDPATAGYFNGANAGSVNLTDPANAAALSTLEDHLATFFGSAIGCTGVAANYQGSANMFAVHSFTTPVNKAAFERFVQLVIEDFRTAGLAQADIYTLSTVLDGFRTGGGVANNQICEASDCTTSPYSVVLGGNDGLRFNPPFITVPSGNSIQFVNQGGTHNVEPDTGDGNCASGTLSGFGTAVGGFTNTYSYTPSQAAGTSIPYYCSIHCPGASPDMWGVLNVTASVGGTTTGTTGSNPTTTGATATTGKSSGASILQVALCLVAAAALLM